MRVRALRRTLPAAALGAAAALLLASCGGSGRGLIPSANAGPLQGDFERVVQEAESGGGSCAGTEAALSKTERDYGALPAIDPGLRKRLQRRNLQAALGRARPVRPAASAGYRDKHDQTHDHAPEDDDDTDGDAADNHADDAREHDADRPRKAAAPRHRVRRRRRTCTERRPGRRRQPELREAPRGAKPVARVPAKRRRPPEPAK